MGCIDGREKLVNLLASLDMNVNSCEEAIDNDDRATRIITCNIEREAIRHIDPLMHKAINDQVLIVRKKQKET